MIQIRWLFLSCSALIGWPVALIATSGSVLAIGGGAAPLEVGGGQQVMSTSGHLEFLLDPSRALTLEDVRSPELTAAFEPVRAETPSFGFDSSAYWFRLQIRSELSTAATYYLNLGYPLLDSVQLYVVSEAAVARYAGGDRVPFSERPIEARTFFFPLELQPSQRVTLYLRVETAGSLSLPLSLLSEQAAFTRIATESSMLALYYGALMMLVVYNGYHFKRLHDVNALYYAFFITLYLGFQLSLSGVAFQFLWPNSTWWANVSLPILLCAAYFAGSLFTSAILDTKRNAPLIHRALWFLRWLAVLGIGLALFGPYQLAMQFAVALGFTVVLFIVAGLKISLQGHRPAKYYTSAWVVSLVGMVIYALNAFGVLPTSFLTTWSMQFASLVQAVVLAFAIFDRFYLKEESRRRTQDSYTEVLEHANDALYTKNDGLQEQLQQKVRDLLLANHQLEEKTKVLRVAEQKAEAASRAKSEFLANMSHELRTPMNAVIGFLNLLTSSRLAPAQREHAHKAERSARALMHLIRDLLDFSRMDVGRLELASVPFSVATLVQDALNLVSLNAKEKGLVLRLDQQGVEDCWVEGDEDRLRQVLANLLHNAVKFTESGEVRLEVGCEAAPSSPTAEGTVLLSLSVTDTGIGISEAQQQRLFQPFTQADASITRRFGGTGLGLSISQRLVQRMGGEIRLKSRPGVGSRFSFSLRLPVARPVPELETRSEVALSECDSRDLRVLLVEDQPLNQEVMSALLERAGVTALVAGSGIEALGRLRSAERVDLVLMDLRMPNLDGYETARRIRAIPGCRDLPLIAVTGDASAAERERSRAAGFAAHLAKPIDQQALREVLARCCRETSRPKSPTPKPDDPPADSAGPSTPGPAQSDAETVAGATLEPMPEFGPGLIWPEALREDDDQAPAFVRASDLRAHLDRLRRFAQRYATHAALMRSQIDAGDHQQVAAEAHALAGVAVSLGLPRLGAASRRLEQRAARGQPVPAELMSALELALTEALGSISALGASAEARSVQEQGAMHPGSEASGAAALDGAALRAELSKLQGLLKDHNLRARTVLESLLSQVTDARLGAELEVIGERVRGLDFGAAQQALADLIDQQDPQDD